MVLDVAEDDVIAGVSEMASLVALWANSQTCRMARSRTSRDGSLVRMVARDSLTSWQRSVSCDLLVRKLTRPLTMVSRIFCSVSEMMDAGCRFSDCMHIVLYGNMK